VSRRRRGVLGLLGVISDFGPIDMKFGIEVEFDVLNDYQTFGHNRSISFVFCACLSV